MGITSLVKILDDFFFVESSDATCRKNLYTFIALCEFLGVPIAHDKTAGPSTNLVFLGIKLDSALMVTSLPEDKLTRYSNDITSVLNSRSVNLNTMKSTIGKLQFARSVVTPGKPFLRRLHDTTMNVRKPYHIIRISKPVHADLHMWSNFLQHCNGKTFIISHQRFSLGAYICTLMPHFGGLVAHTAHIGSKASGHLHGKHMTLRYSSYTRFFC